VAIPLPGPDQLPPGPLRDFAKALHELYDEAGQPAARSISKVIFHLPAPLESVSHETVSAVLRGGTPPTWGKVKSIVIALARQSAQQHEYPQLLQKFNGLWVAAREAARSRPQEAGGATDSPVRQKITPTTFPGPSPLQPERSTAAVRWKEVTAPRITSARQQATDGSVRSHLPERNESFIGRESLLESMRAHLSADQYLLLAVHGAIGTGKTQLVREYIERYGQQYSTVLWIPADRFEVAQRSLADLAGPLGLPAHPDTREMAGRVIIQLESRPKHLLVFDGVESEDIRRLIPKLGGHVIVTSRDPKWAHDSSSIGLEVATFTREEVDQFLRSRDIRLTDQQTEGLVRTLGRAPLALEQITASQGVTGLSWADLLSRLQHPGAGLMSHGQPAHYPQTVSATLKVALSRLAEANPAAAVATELFASFGSAPVSVSMLYRGLAGRAPEQTHGTLNNQVQLRRALADICRYGLARLNNENQHIEVPPMVRLALRDILKPEAFEDAQQVVHEILAAADPGEPDDLLSSELHSEIAAHVLPTDLVRSRLVAGQRAVYHQIRYRYLIGEYLDACSLGEAAVTIWGGERFLGPDHLLVLRATQQWANALRALGRYEQARTLTSDALSRLRADPDFGDDHPHTLTMSDSHAADLRITGEYRRALEVAEDTYRRCVERYGEADGRTTMSQHNLAVSLRLVGDFTGAEAADRAALARNTRQRGKDDWRTLLSINALAEDLYGLGRYGEALSLQPQRTESTRPALRPVDRGVLLAERTVALARRALGERAEALELLRRHYETCAALFGADHEYTLAARTSYANTLHQNGETSQAYQHIEAAAAAYRTIFGTRNPLTLATEVNLAVTLRGAGERRRARQTDAVASETLRDTVGDDHPFTIAAMINLATDYALNGSHPVARALSERAYARAKAVRGPDHPDTIVAAANLVIDLTATGAPGAAATLRGEVLAALWRTLGQEHRMAQDIASGVRIECAIEPPST
jgi:tetratricopeptide (TPR) repeat protein